MTDVHPTLVFPGAPQMTVAVAGDARRFPVRRIYCVGRNYGAHIREMGGDEREPPFFFQKPTDAIVTSGATVPYPPATKDFQYEIELVLAIGTGGRAIAVENAAAHVFGLAVGIDLTRRDLQLAARNTGRPWESGKSFDASAPITPIHPLVGATLPDAGEIALSVNGKPAQRGDLSEMIWSCAEIVSHLSDLFELHPGDLIYTGTPAGVGPVMPGDVIRGHVADIAEVVVTIEG